MKKQLLETALNQGKGVKRSRDEENSGQSGDYLGIGRHHAGNHCLGLLQPATTQSQST
jgi:hypothetical protein